MKIIKWLAIVAAGLVVLVVTTLRFLPDIYVSIANIFLQASGQKIQTQNLQVQYFPFRVLSSRLMVLTAEDVVTVEATNLDLGVRIWSALEASEPYWWLIADELKVTPDRLDASPADTAGELLDLETLLSFSELSIDKLMYEGQILKLSFKQADENISIDVSHDLASVTGTMVKIDQGYQVSLLMPSLDVANLHPANEGVSPQVENVSVEKGAMPDFSLLDRWRLSASLREVSHQVLELGFDAEGSARVSGLRPFRLLLDLVVQEVHNANSLGFEFDSVLPVQVGSIIEAEESRLKLGEFELKYLSSDASGQMQFDFGEKFAIVGSIQSTRLQLPESNDQEAPEIEEDVDKPVDDQPLFGAQAIDWSWLDTANVDVSLHADRFDIGDAPFENLEVSVKVVDGALVLSPLHSQFGEGGFEGALELTRAGDGVVLKTNFNLHDVDLESFGFVPSEELVGGATDIVLSLESSGVSLADLAAGLHGDILLMVQGATVQNDTFELFGSDVFMEALHKLNPFSKSDPTTELECALVHFEVMDGVLKSNNQLVIETTKMEIVGDGSIDLKNETIDIGISPSSREGVGVNVGSLIKFMKLGGTLRNPTPEADALGLLQSGAAIGAAVSTGGISILAEGLIKRISNAGSACKRALEKESAAPTDPRPPSETPS